MESKYKVEQLHTEILMTSFISSPQITIAKNMSPSHFTNSRCTKLKLIILQLWHDCPTGALWQCCQSVGAGDLVLVPPPTLDHQTSDTILRSRHDHVLLLDILTLTFQMIAINVLRDRLDSFDVVNIYIVTDSWSECATKS